MKRLFTFFNIKPGLILVFLGLLTPVHLRAQLPNGSVAPDFTLTDYSGNTHNLYSYLNSGKTVFLKIFAAHCPVCWSYHQTHVLRDLYNLYGPAGSNEVMVLALEYDQWNDSNAFVGNGPAWVTQGNWLAGTPYPIFDVEDPYRGVFTDYAVSFYPLIYKICPDRIIERVMTNEPLAQLYQKVQNCQAALAVVDLSAPANSVYCHEGKLWFTGIDPIRRVEIVNLQGQILQWVDNPGSEGIGMSDLPGGLYLVNYFDTQSKRSARIFIP